VFHIAGIRSLEGKALAAQMTADAREALRNYGETLNIRRDSLQPLLGPAREVPISRVHLVYEGGKLKPTDVDGLKAAVDATEEAVPGVEIRFQ
jgi:hypothetical protein